MLELFQYTRRIVRRYKRYGRYRWIEMLQRRILDKVDRMERRQRLILKGLQHYSVFPEAFILNVIAETRLDRSILHVLREVGPTGALPSKIAYQLTTYCIDRFEVTRHIKAMNRRLQKEGGYEAAEYNLAAKKKKGVRN